MQRLRKEEEEEEERKIEGYREIGMRLKGYPEEDVIKARKLVSSFIRAAEEVEQVIAYTYRTNIPNHYMDKIFHHGKVFIFNLQLMHLNSS